MSGNANQTYEQRKERALEAWLNNPTMAFRDIAALAGVSQKTFERYRKDAEFMAEYHRRCKERFASLEGLAMEKLEKKLNAEDWKAIEYTLNGCGYKATDKIQAEIDNTVNITVTVDEEE